MSGPLRTEIRRVPKTSPRVSVQWAPTSQLLQVLQGSDPAWESPDKNHASVRSTTTAYTQRRHWRHGTVRVRLLDACVQSQKPVLPPGPQFTALHEGAMKFTVPHHLYVRSTLGGIRSTLGGSWKYAPWTAVHLWDGFHSNGFVFWNLGIRVLGRER